MMAISSLVTVQAGSHYVGKLLVHCTMSSSVLPSIELIYIVHLHLYRHLWLLCSYCLIIYVTFMDQRTLTYSYV